MSRACFYAIICSFAFTICRVFLSLFYFHHLRRRWIEKIDIPRARMTRKWIYKNNKRKNERKTVKKNYCETTLMMITTEPDDQIPMKSNITLSLLALPLPRPIPLVIISKVQSQMNLSFSIQSIWAFFSFQLTREGKKYSMEREVRQESNEIKAHVDKLFTSKLSIKLWHYFFLVLFSTFRLASARHCSTWSIFPFKNNVRNHSFPLLWLWLCCFSALFVDLTFRSYVRI